MNNKLFWQLNRAICLALWGALIYVGVKLKKWLPLLILAALHTVEVFLKGIPTAKERGICAGKAALLTLIFGFTWWLPTKKGL